MKEPLIKVCGVTTVADALYAVRLGADAIGMILYPKSPRFIPLERAKEIASALPSKVKKVAVVVNASIGELNEIVDGKCFDVLQFHGDEDDERIGAFQKKIEVWKALPLNSDAEYAQALASPADCIVVDSRSAGAYGGTGIVGNWAFAAKVAAARRVILAGGLTPENSVAAWETVQPDGLDFNSGVETAPGKKDCKKLDALFAKLASKKESIMKPSEVYFGQFGGRYVAETLMPTLYELTDAYEAAKADPAFQQELEYYLKNYIGRESPLTFAANLTATLGGAKIYLKREDLNHTGAHKVNNTIGQALLARRMGKKKVIAETGAGMHGVATATVAALFGMECEVFMGATDIERQAPNVDRMKVLGAKIHSVDSGTGTLKDAMNEAIRHWIANSADTFYVIGTVAGPAPYPAMVRDFQAVIGKECRRQFQQINNGRLPDEVIACVGGGSNAMGIFSGFLDDSEVKLIGVEAGGMGIETGEHAASINGGEIGVLHGCKTYLLQTPEGQIVEAYSVSAGLDYPGVGPEHAALHDSGRVLYTTINDQDAIAAFDLLCRKEGIIPALESSHALAEAIRRAPLLSSEQSIVVNLSGRGDKDMENIRRYKEKHNLL